MRRLLCLHYQASSLRHIVSNVSESGEDRQRKPDRERERNIKRNACSSEEKNKHNLLSRSCMSEPQTIYIDLHFCPLQLDHFSITLG